MNSYVKTKGLADYITRASGNKYAIRESSELLLGLSNRYNETISNRIHNTELYKEYLRQRNSNKPEFYILAGTEIVMKTPVALDE